MMLKKFLNIFKETEEDLRKMNCGKCGCHEPTVEEKRSQANFSNGVFGIVFFVYIVIGIINWQYAGLRGCKQYKNGEIWGTKGLDNLTSDDFLIVEEEKFWNNSIRLVSLEKGAQIIKSDEDWIRGHEADFVKIADSLEQYYKANG